MQTTLYADPKVAEANLASVTRADQRASFGRNISSPNDWLG
jgi:hypothetical protein